MNRTLSGFLCIVLCSCLTMAQPATARLKHAYNENVFLILDYPILPYTRENSSIPLLLNKGLDGLLFHLERAPISGDILVTHPGNGSIRLADALIEIRHMLENDSSRMFTLMLDFGFSASLLQPVLNEAGLASYVYGHNTSNEWPDIQYLIKKGQRLVVFSTQSVPDPPAWMTNLADLAISPLFTASGELKIMENMQHLDSRKSLMVFNGFRSSFLQFEGDFETFTRNRPHVLDLFVDTWTRTGTMPNFIMIDNLKWLGSDFLMKLRSFGFVRGIATFNSGFLNRLEWEGLNSITQGVFCFPLLPGDKITLTPHCPGYRFKPRSIVIESSSDVSVVQFQAFPVVLAKDLELYLPLRKNARDWSPLKRNGKASKVRFSTDPVRHQVAEFSHGSSIGIEKAEVLKMTDHGFTVATWLKIREFDSLGSDVVVLGSKSFAYQRGLHLMIRQKKPYMGFFNNDLSGNTEIKDNQWFHLVWRFNQLSGEQAIFVNGRLDANAFNRHSYKGLDSLFVGIVGFSDRVGFKGEISDLTIWSRPLGEEEIVGLYNGTLRLPMNGFFFWRWPVWSLPLILIGVVVFINYLFSRSRRTKYKKRLIAEPVLHPGDTVEGVQTARLIRLFGDFTVISNEGKNITALFTPKLKQLLIALLVNSAENKGGLSPREISEMLWEGQESHDTKNKRAVTLRNLRIALAGLPGVFIEVEGKWNIRIPESVNCDYYRFLQILRDHKQVNHDLFKSLWEIIRQGEFCKGESHSWLDESKGDVGSFIIDYLSDYLQTLHTESDIPMIIRVSDQIFLYDHTNEAALAHKVRALVLANKHSQAKMVYNKFCSLYADLYGEKFQKSFNQLMHK